MSPHAVILVAIVTLLLCASFVTGVVTKKPIRHNITKTKRVAGSAKPLCPSSCRFRFCEAGRDSVLMTVPNAPVTPAICLQNFAPLRVSRLGEPYIETEQDGRIPISKLHIRRPDIKPAVALPPNAFVPRNTSVSSSSSSSSSDQSMPTQYASALATSSMNWRQRTLLDGKCIHVPIVNFSLVPSASSQTDPNPMMSNSDTDCISFKAIRPRLEVRLRWYTPDDLDLEVMEPGGSLLYHTQKLTAAGQFLNDDNNEDCLSNSYSGLEAVAYRPGRAFIDGVYVVRIRRFTTCTGYYSAPTRFQVVVLLDGLPWFRHADTARDTSRDGTIYSSLIRLTFNNGSASYKIGDVARD